MARSRPKRRSSAAGAADALVSRLEGLFAAIVAQVRDDARFATRVQAALQAHPPTAAQASKPRAAPAPPPAPKHKPAVLDPFVVYEQGWEVMLQQRLERLNASQLGDIVHQYELDPQDRVSDEKSPQRLREWIVKAVLRKAEKV